MGHGDVLGWLVNSRIHLRSFYDYNGSERFMRLYDATTGFSVSLSLACRLWKAGILFSSRYLFGKV